MCENSYQLEFESSIKLNRLVFESVLKVVFNLSEGFEGTMKSVFWSFGLLLLHVEASAFLNIESLRQVTKSGFNGSTGVKASGATGNTDVFTSNVSTQNIFKNSSEEYIGILNYTYGEANDEKNANKGNIHLRYARWVGGSWLAVELFGQSEFNEFQNLILRNLAGSGFRSKLYNSDGLSFYLGVGAFYEKEDLKDFADQETVRGNTYFSMKKDFEKLMTLSLILYYQPNTKIVSDYRFRAVLGFEYKMTEKLIFNVQYSRAEDTLPPPDVEKLDTSFLTGINWRY